MSKWEDTVIQQIYPVSHAEHLNQLQRQAEISFKAGEKKVVEFIYPILGDISEIVADIRGDWNDPRSRCHLIHELIDKWLAFLKSEGIE